MSKTLDENKLILQEVSYLIDKVENTQVKFGLAEHFTLVIGTCWIKENITLQTDAYYPKDNAPNLLKENIAVLLCQLKKIVTCTEN